MLSYDKCKDTSPDKTVTRIKDILNNVNIQTDIEWTKQEYHDAFSNRITLSPTSLGTNGKGTDIEYALASGYAELIERIENGTILIGYQSPSLRNSFGFVNSPDEVMIPLEQLAIQNDPFTNFIFNHYQAYTTDARIDCLRKLPRLNDDSPESLRCIPFTFPAKNKIVFIPTDIMLPIYGSNGMSAGNTMEEALVQGICEILERYANKAVIEGVVPPEIPREYWDQSPISKLIHDIERSGRYRVMLYDCSLGKNIPATAIVISDLENGKFGIHFSCHPSFDVSIERTLTEALQGKTLEVFTKMNTLGDSQMCSCVDNYPNLMKIGFGAYPLKLFYSKPSYKFEPRNDWNGLSNKEMLIKLLRIIKEEGYEVLIRDASHLDFPAYHVLVPGMSEMFFSNGRRLKELNTLNRVAASMKHFPNLSSDEENRLLLLMRYKEFSALENTLGWITTLPLINTRLSTERVRAFLHFKRHEFQDAYSWFSNASKRENEAYEKLYLACAAEYSRLLSIGASSEEAMLCLSHYYPDDIARKTHETLCIPSQALKKEFPPLTCDQCCNCSHAGNNCEYPEIAKVMANIKGALAKSHVSQNALLKSLNKIAL